MENLASELALERSRLRSLQEIAHAVGSTLNLDDLLGLLVDRVTQLMRADRSTLYVLDEELGELWTKVMQADEVREIRLKVGEGVAGWVAKHGEAANIADAYQDARFSPEVDKRSGYRTRSILCSPLIDNHGHIVGVIQVLNRQDGGPFGPEDAELLGTLASHASIAIKNSQLYQAALRNNQALLETQAQLERRKRELEALLEIEQHFAESKSVDELLEGLLESASQTVGAEAASILIEDEKTGRLIFRSALGERGDAVRQLSVRMGEGVAGWVAQHQEPARVNSPKSDARFSSDLAHKLSFYPCNILCVPVRGRSVRGALELLNKVGRDNFDEGDQTLLTLIGGRAAQAIELAHEREQRELEGRLAGVGRMVAGVLHDLKTPMTIISGYAQLMVASEESETRKQYLDQILHQFEMMSAMAGEVLAFAKGETRILIRRVYLQKFFGEMEQHLKHLLAGKNIELVVKADYRGVAYFDEIKMRRVFHNIARNAADAMPDGGTFSLSVAEQGDRLVFRFSDTGCGIPEELEGRLFDLFATARKEKGTGLGLALVKKVVEEHKGTVSYESDTTAGTTFVIDIPLVREHEGTGTFAATG